MSTFVPMLELFYIAYNFDHIGIVNLAITNLGLWLGVSVTPKQLLTANIFNSETLIYTCAGLGCMLLIFAWLTQINKVKKYFSFSYRLYGIHLSFIALLAGYYYNYQHAISVAWLLTLLLLAVFPLSLSNQRVRLAEEMPAKAVLSGNF